MLQDAAQTGPRPALLTANNLNKYYGGLRALRDVNLTIEEGEIIALVGDNGAGKSTLIKTLSGAIVPEEGEIVFEGKPVVFRGPTDATDVGIETVHQSLGLVDELDVPLNVFLGRELTRKAFGFVTVLDRAEMRKRTYDLLNNFSIGLPTLNEPVLRLSGGQRQTIAISRLLLAQPKLLIMDEPMAALGVDEGSKVLALVEELRKKGITTLIISHNLEHVFSIADRIAVMKNGTMIDVVRTEDVTRSDIVSMITVGRA
jgi:ABC-type sugar transport system ATPase subunit